MNRRPLLIIALLALIVLCLAAAGIGGSIRSRRAMPSALALLESDERVLVTEAGWIAVQPAGAQPDTGLIFFPGGYVDVRAYAPLARALAERGFLVVLVDAPLSTALLALGEPARIIAAFPQITYWAVGGHSLGGVAAARVAFQNPDLAAGLLLIASAPADSDNLSGRDLSVLAIFGSADRVFPQADLNPDLLPPDSRIAEISGANHAQFGRYGSGTQSGDGVATISREEQEAQTAQAAAEFLSTLK